MTKRRCKDYYNLFQEGKTTEPTAVKRWSSFFPYFATSWKLSFNTIYKSTKANKLREFGYKILHRILVTNKKLKKFKIRNDDLCDQCKTPASLENTLLQNPAKVKLYHENLSWLNVSHNTLINIIGDKLLLNFGAKFQRLFVISHVKLQNCHGNLPYVSVSRWRRSFNMP